MKNEENKTPVLEVEGLNVFYPDTGNGVLKEKKQIQVLKDVSFSMDKGEILGLVGESGCGKTSLARAILGINRNYEGRIVCTSEFPQMVFQDPFSSLNPAKKIGWILEEPLKNRTKSNAVERREKVVGMLEQVGLDEGYAGRYPNELSGGQRQRIGIAAALMLEPSLLIADEPVSALDVTIQAQIVQLMMQLHRKMGLAILFISHDLRVVYQISSRVMIMKNGKIIEMGNTEEIYGHPKEEYTKELLTAAGIRL